MAPSKNRRWLLAHRPGNRIRTEDFEWVESPVPEVHDGEMLIRTLSISLDPTLILFASTASGELATPIGGVMRSLAAGRVVESHLAGFRAGDLVQGFLGWEDYTVSNGKGVSEDDLPVFKIPEGLPPNRSFGALGITGMAAYFGVTEVARPSAGETFVVSSAAGGVGSVAGQIAKILGLRTVGIAGGRERCDWVVRELGLDAAIDRRSEDVGARLTALCPEGIDVYFDNAGLASLTDEVLSRLRPRGRIVLCGATSWYLESERPPGPGNYVSLIMKQGRMEGILAREYVARFPEARATIAGWIREGRLKSPEDVVVGLENTPKALARVFEGTNFGKQLVQVADG